MTDYPLLMTDVDKIKLEILCGTVEIEQRVVFDGNRMGYQSRAIFRDMKGTITKTSKWEPPHCWLVFPEPEPVNRPWWKRLLM